MVWKKDNMFAIMAALWLVSAPNSAIAEESNSEKSTSFSSANPFYSGCLYQKDTNSSRRPRVCNSNDPAEALQEGYCRSPDFDYLEIRIAVGNWDSATMLGWLTQIVLSEIAGIPSTIESGMYGSSRDFYDIHGAIDYDTGLGAVALETAASQPDSDCRNVPKLPGDAYETCAHFFPEYWGEPDPTQMKVEPSQATGFLGFETWYVTKFTAQAFPQFVSYYGLEQPENRELLAATFKRPATWKQYCEEVSLNNCSVPDEVAQRPPETEQEAQQMFASTGRSRFDFSETPWYTGHFRYTEKNNCTMYPTNCTGHIANYPCGWRSNMENQLYYQNIPLDPNNGPDGGPNGYTESQLKEIWHAANYTKSHLMMQWWQPTPLYQHYLGTDAEMQQVTRRPYTRKCAKAREEYRNECDDSWERRIGVPEEACGDPVEPMRKLINVGLREALSSPDIPEAAKSPAYDILRFFAVTEIQLGELFDALEAGPTPREAVCNWAIENLDTVLEKLIPPTYPRVTRDEGHSSFGVAAMVVGGVAVLVVVVTSYFVYQKRTSPSIQYAQVDFLGVLLVGSFLVAIGSILFSAPASNVSCIASIWFVFLGYNIELLPLILKVATINRLMSAARDLRRVIVKRTSLYKTLASISLCLAIYLAIWTAVSPPKVVIEYSRTDSTTQLDEVVVDKTLYCKTSTDSNAWALAALVWNVILLVVASILAFQSRHVVSAFNETRTLAMLIYSHFIFVLARISILVLRDHIKGSALNYSLSLVYALDQITACAIYFMPKFILTEADTKHSSSNSLSGELPTRISSSKRFIAKSLQARSIPNAVDQLREAARAASEGTSEQFALESVGVANDPDINSSPMRSVEMEGDSFNSPSAMSFDPVNEESGPGENLTNDIDENVERFDAAMSGASGSAPVGT